MSPPATPVFGRGITTTLWQVEALLRFLDHDAADPEGVGHALDDFGETEIRPWVEDHIQMDAAHVERWSGVDVDLDAPLPSDLILAAAEVRPEIMQSAQGYLSMHAHPGTLRRAEPVAQRGVRRRLASVVRPRTHPRRARGDRPASGGRAAVGVNLRPDVRPSHFSSSLSHGRRHGVHPTLADSASGTSRRERRGRACASRSSEPARRVCSSELAWARRGHEVIAVERDPGPVGRREAGRGAASCSSTTLTRSGIQVVQALWSSDTAQGHC